MAHLTLSLLGSLQVKLGATPITHFRSDKVRALLAYLCLEADYPHRRAALAGLLWPEISDPAANNNLRLTLLRLRRLLGDSPAGAPPVLLMASKTIQFNRACAHRLDVAEFSSLIQECERHPHRRLESCASCAQRLSQAVELYRGDLLEGFFLDSQPFEEWLLVRREALRAQALEAMRTLAAYHESQPDSCQAEYYARRQLALEPWREEATAIGALWPPAGSAAALAQYETCCSLRADELAEPGYDIHSFTSSCSMAKARRAARCLELPSNPPASPFFSARPAFKGEASLGG
jgi:DNA-binding SARP family transcriptional activator